ncbi:26S proteasome non-ATPase regulatory subunit 1 homolog A-like [Gastrolobium bilobum]|uniref:26S proteasome non-ATPase regulatory subunit 1 homolog A-like n=1 Tax=Gastrolobium bilobum TaxID=150636 RepID=UPI002AAFC5F2|nr:26S proteasome non-ATPase regulatory subunit 1 homolog A-like [Gastrolobium bilobum]
MSESIVVSRESLYEDEEFDHHQRKLAALLVSKVFYYLGELNDSLSYALGAGPLFDDSDDSDYVHTILVVNRESLYEDEEFDHHQRKLAALLVSKVFYYLGELNDSLSYALGAGPPFDDSDDSDYVHTILAKAIDEYASFKSKAAESSDESLKVDSRLEAIVERMLDKYVNLNHSCGRSALAIPLKSYGIARAKRAEVGTLVELEGFSVFLVKVFQKLPSPDYMSICQCLMFLDEPDGVASILEKLLRSEDKDDALLAFQIAFDLVENEHQAFLLNVRGHLSLPKSQPAESAQHVVLFHWRFLDWLSRATNWAKFSATAGLGVIHRGHLQQGRSLMAPYLPQGGTGGGGSPFSEGGALYALGLIHANHGEGIKQFIRDSLRSTTVEVLINNDSDVC